MSQYTFHGEPRPKITDSLDYMFVQEWSDLVPNSSNSMDQPLIQESFSNQNNNSVFYSCPHCLCETDKPIQKNCGRIMCQDCIQQNIQVMGSCVLCCTHQYFNKNQSTVDHSLTLDQGNIPHGSVQPLNPTRFLSGDQQQQQVNYITEWQTPAVIENSPYIAPLDERTANDTGIVMPLMLETLTDFAETIDLNDLTDATSRTPWVKILTPKAALPLDSTPTHAPVVEAASRSHQPLDTANIKRKRRRKQEPQVSIPCLTWQKLTCQGSPPSPRYDCGFSVYNNLLIVVGGIVGKDRVNDLHLMDLKQSPPKWYQPTTSGSPPPAGSLLQAFVIDHHLYVIGGTTDGKFLTELHAMNLASGEFCWEKVTFEGQPPSMRYWYSVAVIDKWMVLYGGYGHPKRLDDTFVLRFDLEKPTWVQLNPTGDLPGPSSTHSVCVYQKKMYIFGGYDGKARRRGLYCLELGNFPQAKWTRIIPNGRPPAPRYTHSSTFVGSRMIIYGGNTGVLKNDLHLLDMSQNVPQWTLVKSDSTASATAWHRVCIHNESMYVFGGHTTNGIENAVYKLPCSTLK